MVDNFTPLLIATLLVLILLISRWQNKIKPVWKLPKSQSVPSETRNEGESAVYRAPEAPPHGQPLIYSHKDYPNVNTVYDAFLHGLEVSKNQPCFGVRVNDGPFVYETYAEVYDRILNFGSGLLECGLEPKSDNFVGILGKNCPEWVIAELACTAYSLVTVPLYDTLGPDAIKFVINQTNLSVVIVEAAKLENVLSVANQCPSLKYVIKIGSLTPQDKKLAKDVKISLLYFKGMEAMGKDARKDPVPPSPHDLFVICYTSGTTGDPKGVMLTHRNTIADVAGILSLIPSEAALNHTEIHLSFLPLAHVFEMLLMTAILGLGARVAFYRGDVLKLLDDVVEAKPSIFPVVPRLMNRIYGKINQTLKEASPIRQFLFQTALKSKRNLLRQGILTKTSFWDRMVFNTIQARLGGNVRLMITGAAPISADVLEFFRSVFGCEVLEGYGSTEVCAAATITRFGDYTADYGGHVGGVAACCEIKLVDIPEMDYFATDENPRGEVWIRGESVFKGYFQKPELTADALTEDGWCKTGDVGMMLPGGKLKIIDRKKNLFKLSQGEYIAPEKIENVYAKAPMVAQVFVHGESIKSSLIAIVVVDREQIEKYCKSQGISLETTDAWLNGNKEFKAKVLSGMIDLGKQSKLHSFEQVKDIYLTFEQFSVENGLLTPTFKSKRPQIKARYKEQLEKIYKNFD